MISMVMLVLMKDILEQIFFKGHKEADLILMMHGDGVTKAVHCIFLVNTMKQSNATTNQSKLIPVIQLYGITKVLQNIFLVNTMNP